MLQEVTVNSEIVQCACMFVGPHHHTKFSQHAWCLSSFASHSLRFIPCTMVVWSYFLHQPHAVTTHLQSHCCMWLMIFKVILLSIYNPTALDDSWRVISPFCNTVPGLHLLPKNSVLCLSVLASSLLVEPCSPCLVTSKTAAVHVC